MSAEKEAVEVDLKAAVEAGEEVEAKVEVADEPTWSPEEAAEAEAMGWIPPERAGKLPEGKKFVEPKEYMERNPLYRKMKDMEKSVKQLAEHHQRVSEVEHKKAAKEFEDRIATLEAEKIQALDDADHKLVGEIDKELRTAEKPVETESNDNVLQSWIDDGNSWYNDDSFLRTEADILSERMYYTDGLSGVELGEAVKSHLKQKFPDKFSNPNREKPSAVEGGTTRPAPKNKAATGKDLTADEKTIFNNFKKMGVFAEEGSEQKYLDEVMALRD